MIPQPLITTATVIGLFVIFAWTVLLAWLILKVIGEFRFNRAMKRRSERDFDNLRSSWLLDMQKHPHTETDGANRYDTVEIPLLRTSRADNVRYLFANEDFQDTEVTGAVFDIRERYHHEFARHPQGRPEVHGR